MIFIVIVALTLLLSFEIAVILTFFPLPAFFVTTTPFELTVAYFVLLLFHVTFLLAAFDGLTDAVIFTDFPATTVVFEAFNLSFETLIVGILIITVCETSLPSFAVAVILTTFPAPADLIFTIPFELTVAYFVLLLFHVTCLLVAFEGYIVVDNLKLLPTLMILGIPVILFIACCRNSDFARSFSFNNAFFINRSYIVVTTCPSNGFI